MTRLEVLRKQRIAMAALIRELSTVDGKHWNRLGDATQERIMNAAQSLGDSGITVQIFTYPGSTSAPVVSTTKAKDLLEKIEEEIHLIDSLESNPLLDDARKLLDALADIEEALRTDSGVVGGLRVCAQAGLLRGYPVWGY